MLKRLCVWMLFLLLAVPALAEEIPTLPGTFVLSGLPRGLSFNVYTGPGKTYYVANAGKAKVSTNDVIHCYGRVDDEWLMVSYEIGEGKSRIGYISMAEYPQYMPDCQVLDFADVQLQINHAFVTDDPYGTEQVIGTFHEKLTVLAWTSTGNWAYVEGKLSEYSAPARGFIQKRKLNLDQLTFDLPQRANVHDHIALEERYELNLPDDAMADGMNVYPLADGSYLIAYRCEGSDKLWMRVVSSTGRKLFAKSVPELYLSQITLTDSGFICETFDDSEICSGTRYTYICKGNKWKSAKIKYVDDPDRFYSENTVNFTLRRYPFGEGSVIPMDIEYRPTGAIVRHQMTYGSEVLLCEFEDFEYEDHLIVYAEDENGVMAVRMYDTNGQMVGSAASPMTASVDSVWGFRNAIWFYENIGSAWRRWRLDAQTFTFDEPLVVAAPEDCTLTVLCGETSGDHLVLLDANYASALCLVTSYGSVQLVCRLEGDAIWAMHVDGGLLLLQQMEDGKFILQRYNLSNG